MSQRHWLAGACVGALLMSGVVIAEPEPVRDRARTYLVLRLVDALDLPEEKALALRDVFRHWDQERERLLRDRAATHEKLHAALDKKPPDPVALKALVEAAVAFDRELATLPERSFAAAEKLLTVEQQAKLLLLRRDLQGQVHTAVRHRLRAAAGRGRHPPTTVRTER